MSSSCANLLPSYALHSSALMPRGWAQIPQITPASHVASLGGIVIHLPAGYSHKGCTEDSSSYTETVLQFTNN